MDDDPTKLTSFQPLTPIVSSGGFSISRLFDFGRKSRKSSQATKLDVTPEQSRKKSTDRDRKEHGGSSSVNNASQTKTEAKHEKVC